jgi:hypothetical protein
MADETKQRNTQPGIALDGKARQYGGDVEVTPHEGIAIRASLMRFRADNSILFRRPENFDVSNSVYMENGRSREAGIALRRAALSFDADVTRFTNSGDTPFDLDRFRLGAGFDLPLKTKMGVLIEYANDKYRERNAASSDFRATRIGVFLRYHP